MPDCSAEKTTKSQNTCLEHGNPPPPQEDAAHVKTGITERQIANMVSRRQTDNRSVAEQRFQETP